MLALGPVLLRCPQGGAGDSAGREGCTENMQETVNEKENMVETPDSLDAAAFEEAGIVPAKLDTSLLKVRQQINILLMNPPQVLSRPPVLATPGTAATGSAAGTFVTGEPSCQFIRALLS